MFVRYDRWCLAKVEAILKFLEERFGIHQHRLEKILFCIMATCFMIEDIVYLHYAYITLGAFAGVCWIWMLDQPNETRSVRQISSADIFCRLLFQVFLITTLIEFPITCHLYGFRFISEHHKSFVNVIDDITGTFIVYSLAIDVPPGQRSLKEVIANIFSRKPSWVHAQ